MPADKWRIYEIDGDPQSVTDWLDAHSGHRYDKLGLLGFVFRPIKGLLDSWFCSEACADMISMHEPWRYEVALFESVVLKIGRRVQ